MLANLDFAAAGKIDIDVRNGLVRRGAQLDVTSDGRPGAIGPRLVEENIQSHRTFSTAASRGHAPLNSRTFTQVRLAALPIVERTRRPQCRCKMFAWMAGRHLSDGV